MFRCQICGQSAPAGSRANKVVLASRAKSYSSRGGQDGFQRQSRFRGGSPPNKRHMDKGGKGHEIAVEVLACDACAAKTTPAEPVTETVAPAVEAPSTVDAPIEETPPADSE